MKQVASTLSIGAATALLLGITATPAIAADVTTGHVDIVEIECIDGVYDVGSHVGDTHVDPADIGGYDFVLDRSASGGNVVYNATSASHTVTGGGTADDFIPDLGFAYEASGAGCAPTLVVSWSASGAGAVRFNGNTSVTLSQNQHAHGTWTYTGATSSTATYAYAIAFDVPALGESIDPVNVRIQP